MIFEKIHICSEVSLTLLVFYLTLKSEMMLIFDNGFYGFCITNIRHKNITCDEGTI